MKNNLLPRLAGCLAATVSLLGSGLPARADLEGSTLWGSTGVIAMPAARIGQPGHFRLNGSYVFSTSHTAGLHSANLALLDNLEFGLLYGVGLPVQGFSGLAGHLKWLAVKPSVIPLSLAFGGELLGMNNNAGYYYGNSLYGVISYEFNPLGDLVLIRPHFGISGNGLGVRMMAGLEVPLFDTVLLAGEYHSQQGRNGDFYNFGTRFNLPLNFSVGLYTLGRPGRPFGDRDYTLQFSFKGGLPFSMAAGAKEKDEPMAIVTPPPAPPAGLIATTQIPTVTPAQLSSLTGQLFDDQSHAPLAGFRVFIRGHDQVSTTDPAGRFAISDVPPGSRELVIQQPMKDVVLATRTLSMVGGQTFMLELLIPKVTLEQRRGTITGQVVDAHRRGLPHIQVRVEDQEGVAISTGPDGAYTLKDIPPGTHRLSFSQGGRILYTTSVKLDPAAGTARENVVLPIAPVPSPSQSPSGPARVTPTPAPRPLSSPTPVAGTLGALSGRIHGPAAHPLSGARVMVESGDLTAMTLSGPDGSFQIRELPPGKYKLTVSRNGFVTRVIPLQVQGPRDRQDVTLSRK